MRTHDSGLPSRGRTTDLRYVNRSDIAVLLPTSRTHHPSDRPASARQHPQRRRDRGRRQSRPCRRASRPRSRPPRPRRRCSGMVRRRAWRGSEEDLRVWLSVRHVLGADEHVEQIVEADRAKHDLDILPRGGGRDGLTPTCGVQPADPGRRAGQRLQTFGLDQACDTGLLSRHRTAPAAPRRLIVTEPAAQKPFVALSERRGKLLGSQGPAGCCHCVAPCAPVLIAGVGERPVEVPQDGARETCWRLRHRGPRARRKTNGRAPVRQRGRELRVRLRLRATRPACGGLPGRCSRSCSTQETSSAHPARGSESPARAPLP